MDKGKYLSIDYGDKRVGLAVSDLNKEIAFPRGFLTVESDSGLLSDIAALCREDSIIKIIVGLPIQMDGSAGRRAEMTYEFGERLTQKTGLPVEYFDERLTTRAAEGKLREIGVKSRDQKGEKDAVSAQLILETYLRSRRP